MSYSKDFDSGLFSNNHSNLGIGRNDDSFVLFHTDLLELLEIKTLLIYKYNGVYCNEEMVKI